MTGVHARQHLRLRTGSSPRVSQNWPHNPSSRRRRRCSWSASPGQCRSCSSGPSPLRSRERTKECNERWVNSGRTCRRCGCLWRCASWNTRWHPFRGASTASQPARRGAGSICRRSRRTWGCRWAPVAGRPAWRRSCWGTADSRTGNTAHWRISGSSLKTLWQGEGQWIKCRRTSTFKLNQDWSNRCGPQQTGASSNWNISFRCSWTTKTPHLTRKQSLIWKENKSLSAFSFNLGCPGMTPSCSFHCCLYKFC